VKGWDAYEDARVFGGLVSPTEEVDVVVVADAVSHADSSSVDQGEKVADSYGEWDGGCRDVSSEGAGGIST
jgi:hypothetical protein